MFLRSKLCILAGSLLCWGAAHAVIVTDMSSAAGWAPILYLGNSDPTGDQQTANPGNEADIVGDSVSAALYKYYDGTNFGFRLRLGAEDNPKQGYQSAVMIGMDITGDHILDFYIGAAINGVGSGSEKFDIGIYQFLPGIATSPDTTQAALASPSDYLYAYEQSGTNFNWSPTSDIDPGLSSYQVTDPDTGITRTVDPYNVDGQLDKGDPKPDHYLTFIVPYADLIAAFRTVVPSFDASSKVSFVAITSQNLNQVNNDFNGIDDSNLGTPYGEGPDGGGISETYTPEALVPVPEPVAYAFLLSFLALFIVFSRRKLT